MQHTQRNARTHISWSLPSFGCFVLRMKKWKNCKEFFVFQWRLMKSKSSHHASCRHFSLRMSKMFIKSTGRHGETKGKTFNYLTAFWFIFFRWKWNQPLVYNLYFWVNAYISFSRPVDFIRLWDKLWFAFELDVALFMLNGEVYVCKDLLT